MLAKDAEDCLRLEWLQSRVDPVREELVGRGKKPDLDAIRHRFPPTTGAPAFDRNLIQGNIERLVTVPEINTGHPFLDLSVKTGLAFIDATFQGDHPKYGIKEYGANCHDAFPPTIIAAVDALSGWGLNGRATQLFRYWLQYFVKDDGTIAYRGTSLAELGQLLHTATLLAERCGPANWWSDGRAALERIVIRLLDLRRASEKDDGLLSGVPEDDEKEKIAKYFHNNAWVARGLRRWAGLCEQQGFAPATAPALVHQIAEALAADSFLEKSA